MSTERLRRLAMLAAVLMSTLLMGAILNAAEAQDWELLPDAALRLEGARYAPADTEAAWTSWVGAGVGVFRFRNATAYLAGDAETVFGNARRTFDADQVNYHLESGARFRLGPWLLVPFFHHVSRHLIDRAKQPNDDWNIAGARLARTSGIGDRLTLRYEVGLGRNVRSHFVDYQWELTGRVEADQRAFDWGGPFAGAAARLVTTSGKLERQGFVDATVEGGLRFRNGHRRLDLFVAYEHRNDVLLLSADSRNRALFGLRLASAPPDYLATVRP